MKKEMNTPDYTGKSADRYFVRVVSLILIGLLLNVVLFGQSSRLGLRATSEASGNGFGTLYSPGLYIGLGKTAIIAGPSIQKRGGRVTGAQISFERSLCVSMGRRIQLFGFTNFAWHDKAVLGRSVLKLEQQVNPEAATDLARMQFSALEAHGGFGLYAGLGKTIHLFGSIGAGAFQTTPSVEQPFRLYRPSASASLQLKAGLFINLIKKN